MRSLWGRWLHHYTFCVCFEWIHNMMDMIEVAYRIWPTAKGEIVIVFLVGWYKRNADLVISKQLSEWMVASTNFIIWFSQKMKNQFRKLPHHFMRFIWLLYIETVRTRVLFWARASLEQYGVGCLGVQRSAENKWNLCIDVCQPDAGNYTVIWSSPLLGKIIFSSLPLLWLNR